MLCPFILEAMKDTFNSLCSVGDNLINGGFAESMYSDIKFPLSTTHLCLKTISFR